VTYVGLEAEASAIATYQAEYVPGLLQTPEYASAVHRAALMATVIGAMIVAPLMTPILGIVLAVVLSDRANRCSAATSTTRA
jgi:hypothetical protein